VAVDEAEEHRGVREREEGHEVRLQPRPAGEVAVALHRAGFYGALDLARAEAPDGEREDPRDPRDRPHQVRAGRRRRREEWIACRGGSGVREAGDDRRGLEAPDRAAPEPVGRKDELRRRPNVRDRVVRERGPDALHDPADPRDARRDDSDDPADDPRREHHRLAEHEHHEDEQLRGDRGLLHRRERLTASPQIRDSREAPDRERDDDERQRDEREEQLAPGGLTEDLARDDEAGHHWPRSRRKRSSSDSCCGSTLYTRAPERTASATSSGTRSGSMPRTRSSPSPPSSSP